MTVPLTAGDFLERTAAGKPQKFKLRAPCRPGRERGVS
jgi:hypothetical protein